MISEDILVELNNHLLDCIIMIEGSYGTLKNELIIVVDDYDADIQVLEGLEQLEKDRVCTLVMS